MRLEPKFPSAFLTLVAVEVASPSSVVAASFVAAATVVVGFASSCFDCARSSFA